MELSWVIHRRCLSFFCDATAPLFLHNVLVRYRRVRSQLYPSHALEGEVGVQVPSSMGIPGHGSFERGEDDRALELVFKGSANTIIVGEWYVLRCCLSSITKQDGLVAFCVVKKDTWGVKGTHSSKPPQ